MTLKPVLEEFARERDTYREFFLARKEWHKLFQERRLGDPPLEDAMLRIIEAFKACEVLEGIREAVKADIGCCDDSCVACEAITHAEQPR